MENQEESQKGGGLNRDDKTTDGTMGNQGIRRKIIGLEIKMNRKSKMETRMQMW